MSRVDASKCVCKERIDKREILSGKDTYTPPYPDPYQPKRQDYWEVTQKYIEGFMQNSCNYILLQHVVSTVLQEAIEMI